MDRVKIDAIRNRAMAGKLLRGKAIDLLGSEREGKDGKYLVVGNFVDDVDYCHSSTEQWIWSIGRRKSDGKVLASFSGDLYQNPDFECLWLR